MGLGHVMSPLPRFIVIHPNVVANHLGTNAFIGQPNSLVCEPGCLDCHRIANCHQQVRHTHTHILVAELCPKMPNIRHNWAQFGNKVIKFGVCYLLIQLAILWQSRNPGSHAKLFGCPIKGWSPELFPKSAKKLPNCAEKCRKVAEYCAELRRIFARILFRNLKWFKTRYWEYI